MSPRVPVRRSNPHHTQPCRPVIAGPTATPGSRSLLEEPGQHVTDMILPAENTTRTRTISWPLSTSNQVIARPMTRGWSSVMAFAVVGGGQVPVLGRTDRAMRIENLQYVTHIRWGRINSIDLQHLG